MNPSQPLDTKARPAPSRRAASYARPPALAAPPRIGLPPGRAAADPGAPSFRRAASSPDVRVLPPPLVTLRPALGLVPTISPPPSPLPSPLSGDFALPASPRRPTRPPLACAPPAPQPTPTATKGAAAPAASSPPNSEAAASASNLLPLRRMVSRVWRSLTPQRSRSDEAEPDRELYQRQLGALLSAQAVAASTKAEGRFVDVNRAFEALWLAHSEALNLAMAAKKLVAGRFHTNWLGQSAYANNWEWAHTLLERGAPLPRSCLAFEPLRVVNFTLTIANHRRFDILELCARRFELKLEQVGELRFALPEGRDHDEASAAGLAEVRHWLDYLLQKYLAQEYLEGLKAIVFDPCLRIALCVGSGRSHLAELMLHDIFTEWQREVLPRYRARSSIVL